MKLAFDLDGVLCDINVPLLYMIKPGSKAEEWYYRTRKPLLNPYLFLEEDDSFIIITGRAKRLKSLTIRWVKKYFPEIKLIMTETGHIAIKEIVRKKLQILINEKADIYFDDDCEAIREMRKECEFIKFIQFGGRL